MKLCNKMRTLHGNFIENLEQQAPKLEGAVSRQLMSAISSHKRRFDAGAIKTKTMLDEDSASVVIPLEAASSSNSRKISQAFKQAAEATQPHEGHEISFVKSVLDGKKRAYLLKIKCKGTCGCHEQK